jgi:D-sedoheptulose 7-phosphate isomerase
MKEVQSSKFKVQSQDQSVELKDFVKEYLSGSIRCLSCVSFDEVKNIVDLIWETYKHNKTIFIFGNGGSASIATHFASDLNSTTIGHHKDFKGRRFKAISLTTNVSELTAWANDAGYEKIFSGPLENLVGEGDLVIGISSSGNSPNVVEAVKLARNKRAKSIGLTGMGGGKLKEVADVSLVVDSNHYGQIEGIHSVLTHLITFYLAKKMGEVSE